MRAHPCAPSCMRRMGVERLTVPVWPAPSRRVHLGVRGRRMSHGVDQRRRNGVPPCPWVMEPSRGDMERARATLGGLPTPAIIVTHVQSLELVNIALTATRHVYLLIGCCS